MMTMVRLTRALFCAALLWAAVGQRAGSAGENLTVALNHAPPYRIIETKSGADRYAGFYVDFIKEVAQRTGLALHFKQVPFKRALVMMKQGSADIMLGPNRTPDREAYMHYLDVELSRERKVFYLAPERPDIVSYGDLAGRSIAVLRGARYFDRFDSDGALHKSEVGDYVAAIRMTKMGRVDAVIMPELQGDFLLQNEAVKLTKSRFSVEGRPSFIAISRKSPVMARRGELEEALRDMRTDGTIDEIIGRYR